MNTLLLFRNYPLPPPRRDDPPRDDPPREPLELREELLRALVPLEELDLDLDVDDGLLFPLEREALEGLELPLGLATPLELPLGLATPLDVEGRATPLVLPLGLATPLDVEGRATPLDVVGLATPLDVVGLATPLDVVDGRVVPLPLEYVDLFVVPLPLSRKRALEAAIALLAEVLREPLYATLLP